MITKLLKPNYVLEDVEGAPFKIEDSVVVPDNPNEDDTFSTEFIGKIGHVCFFEYECGCGQTYPTDPMIGVKFSDGKVGEFGEEEIRLVGQ